MPYLKHFGLTDWPFGLAPDRDLFFPEQHQPVLDSLRFAVDRGDPMVKITGEVGTGKTLLCRLLMTELRDQGATVGFLGLPRAGFHPTIDSVCREFGVDAHGATDVFPDLSVALSAEYEAGRQAILVVDEAQALGRKGLETIRLLSNLEMDGRKLLQIVLFGQPELDRLMREYGMRQIRQRVTFSFMTQPFDRQSGARYIRYRVQQLSQAPSNDIFTGPAKKKLVKAAGGTPRTINIVSDRALMIAYAAGSHAVGYRHAKRAVRDTGLWTPRLALRRRRVPS